MSSRAIESELITDIRQRKRVILSLLLVVALGIYRYLLPERPLEYSGPRALADLFFAIGLLILVLLAGLGIGLKITRWLRVVPSSYLETIIFVAPVGLGVIAYGILALGLLGLLEIQYFIAWFVVLFIWFCREWWELVSTAVTKMRVGLSAILYFNIGKKLLLLTFTLLVCLTLVQALTPPWDYDGLMYHLSGPSIFLDKGKILPLPDIWQANSPFTIEMLYMFGLRFGSDTFAKLLHLCYALLLVLATFAFGRRFLGGDGGWIASAILVAIPIMPVWASSSYGDMAWAVYEFVGIYAVILWIKTDRRGWLALAGILIGLALGSKYIGLGILGILGFVVVWVSWQQGLKRLFQNTALFGGIAVLVASPWYLKNWLWTGNPVYPLYFGGMAWPAERVELLMNFLNGFGTGHRIVDYLQLPWTVYSQRLSFAAFYSGIEFPSLLFLLLIFYPFIRHKKLTHVLAVIVLLRLLVWAIGSQQIRFLLPVFPGLSILTAAVMIGLSRTYLKKQSGRILSAGLIGGVVVVTLFLSLQIFLKTRPLGVIIGSESKMDYLFRTNPIIPVITHIQKNIAPTDKVLFMWNGEGYYCDDRCLPDAEQSRWTYLAMTAAYDTPTLAEKLHDAAVTHLLFSRESLNFVLQHDPSGDNYRAALFFLNMFKYPCTELIYSDPLNDLYEITCEG